MTGMKFFYCFCALLAVSSVNAKRSYSIDFQNVETLKLNPEFIPEADFELERYNESTTVLTAEFTYAQDMPLQTEVAVTSWQLQGSKYKKALVIVSGLNICETIKTETFVWPQIRTFSNFPERCPIQKGHYWIRNFVFDLNALPPSMLEGDWRFDVSLTCGNDILLVFAIYIRFEHQLKIFG